MRLQNPVNHRHRDVRLTHQAVQDFHLGHISKKYFRLGTIPPSEWTRSVIAVKDTEVAVFSATGLNTCCRVAYRHPIAVSPVLRAVPVSNCKSTLCR
jgi:hypothetical protein